MSKKKKKNSLKAAIYVRVSTVEQSDNDFSSLHGQLNQCKTWIDQKNTMGGIDGVLIKNFKVYKDTKSGKDLKRPGIERLIKDAESGKIDLLIATKLDRVSRSLKDFLTLYDDLRKNNVALTIVTQNIDTTTIQGELLQTMLMAFAEFERKMNSERTKEKRFETIKAGLWPGGFQILGYDLDERKLVVNEEEAVIVRDIFDRYLQLKSAVKVARSMNKDGYRNKQWITKKGNTRGGGKFHKKSILTILKNHLYLGKYEFDEKIYDGQHQGILEQNTFDKVRSLINENAAKPKSNISSETPAVLTNICTCGFCKNSMTVSGTTKRKNNKYYYYKCTQKNNEGKTNDHNPKDLPVKVLDNFVFDSLRILLKEPELLDAMKKRIKYEGADQIKEIEKRINKTLGILKVLKKDKTNTLKLLTDNATSSLRVTYETQLESIVLEIDENENEIAFLNEQLQKLKSESPIGKTDYKKILNKFVKQFENESVNTKRELTKVLVKNVESHVNQNTNDGIIEVKYIADKRLEVDWNEIKDKKNANYLSKVRTFGLSGSPGRI